MTAARPLSVLHVSQPTDAGVARCVIGFATDQARRGWQVSVACPGDGTLAEAVTGSGVSHIPWPAARAPGPGSLGEAIRLRRAITEVAPDLVHLHSSKAGLAGRLAVRGRTATIFQPNAWSFEAVDGVIAAGSRAWERLGARWTDAIVCVSEAEREAGMRAGISAEWTVVTNGVDLSAYPPASEAERGRARAQLSLDDVPLAVCIGRLSRQKGQDVLLQAWPQVLAAAPRAQLALVGDGPDRTALEAMAHPNVRFAGWSDDVATWLAAADVVVQPSRWEGMSYAMIEALARARSLVASDVAGSRELVDTDAGAIVPVESVAELATAVASRLLDPARTSAEGAAGRARVERAHDLTRNAEALAALYAAVLSRRRS